MRWNWPSAAAGSETLRMPKAMETTSAHASGRGSAWASPLIQIGGAGTARLWPGQGEHGVGEVDADDARVPACRANLRVRSPVPQATSTTLSPGLRRMASLTRRGIANAGRGRGCAGGCSGRSWGRWRRTSSGRVGGLSVASWGRAQKAIVPDGRGWCFDGRAFRCGNYKDSGRGGCLSKVVKGRGEFEPDHPDGPD